MAQIQKGQTFADGDLVTGVKLNNIVDNAVLNPESITDQPLVTTASLNDKFCIYQSESAGLKSITLDSILGISMPPLTISQLLNFATTGMNITSAHAISIGAGDSLTITTGTATGSTGTLSLQSINDVTIGGSASTSTVSVIAPTNISSKLSLTSTGAVKLPVGTTAQRPSIPFTGDLRFNTTTNHTEVYNGTAWEAVGGSPFDATGGNKIIAPDTTVVSASFSSADGITVVVTSTAHTVYVGHTVKIVTSLAGYSGDWKVISTTSDTFTYVLSIPAIANSGTCTYQKAGNYKIHIFTSNGTFTSGDSDGNVELLVVGGGGGGHGVYGGGGGAVCYNPYYSIPRNTTIVVTVGGGGNNNASGQASTFGSVTAFGGHAPNSTDGWGWGGSTGSGSFGVKSINPYDKYPLTVYPWNPSNPKPLCGASSGSAPDWVLFDGNYYYNYGTCIGLDISGIPEQYGQGGAGVDTSIMLGSNGGGGQLNNPRPNSGNGGGVGSPTLGITGAGASGIVIIRYPYWI